MSAPASASSWAGVGDAPSVIVVGHLGDGLGLGEAARGMAAAAVACGARVATHTIVPAGRLHGDGQVSWGDDLPAVGPDAEADVVIVCINPPELAALREQRRPLPSGRTVVGVWAYEVDPLPLDWHPLAAQFDELWGHSPYVVDLLAQTGAPVRLVRAPCSMPSVADAPAAAAPADDRPVFLTLADAYSSLRRKNPLGAIEAFTRAFAPDEARLVVKVWNSHVDPDGMAELHRAAGGRADIEVVERWLPRPELTELVRGASALVSLHRAEGHGLALFEALALGTALVCTGVTGSVDLLDPSTAGLVDATPVAVGAGAHPYPAPAAWFEPDIEAAAALLRAVADDPQAAREQAQRGRAVVERELSVESVGRAVGARLVDLVARHRDRDPRSALRPRATVVTYAKHPWPALEAHLGALAGRPGDVEVVVATADGGTLPDHVRPPGVRRVDVGSASPFDLVAAGLRAARGDLLLITEDHTAPAAGWIEAYLAADDELGLDAYVGPIANGPGALPVDWANYLMTFAAFAPPLDAVPGDQCPTVANVALRSTVIDEGWSGEPGDLERRLLPALWLAGRVGVSPGSEVAHIQNDPARVHLLRHFDDSRTYGAALRAAGAPAPGLSPQAVRDGARHLLRLIGPALQGRPGMHEHHRRAARWLRAVALARVLGAAIGHRFGAGGAADRLA